MKISIEIDVSPDELPLATELINTLRLIKEHVSVNVTQSTGHKTHAPAPSAAPQAPAAPAAAASSTGSVDEQLMRALGAVSVQYTAFAEGDGDSARCVQAAAGDVVRILGAEATTPGVGMPRLVRCVMAIVNNGDFGQRLQEGTVSTAPFTLLSMHLHDSSRSEYVKLLKEFVAKDLAEPRPPGTPRLKVFSLAELFARLVSMGHMPIDSAVNIITRLVKAPDKRMAGMTMLGKTVELCYDLLSDSCSKHVMVGLRDELLALNDPEFSYDVEYTFECIGAYMDWQKPQAPPPAAAKAAAAPAPASAPVTPPPSVGAVVMPSSQGGPSSSPGPELVHSHAARPGGVFAMAVDTTRRCVVVTVAPPSGPEVGQVFDPVHGFRGEFAMAPPGQDSMTNSLDIIPPGVMLASMMPKGNRPGDCCVRLFSVNGAAGESDRGVPPWQVMGCLTRPEARPLVSTRWLAPAGNSYAFVQGEAHRDSTAEGGRRQRVVVFEIAPGANFDTLQPVQQFGGHTNIISAIEPYPDDPNLVLSAAKDATIRLWDRRLASGAAGVLIYSNAATQQAHTDMVVSLAARGPTLLSAGMDKSAAQWDLRVLGRGPSGISPQVAVWAAPDGSPFVRACLAPRDPMVGALATAAGGVFHADVHAAALAAATPGAHPPGLRPAAGPPAGGGRQGRYLTLAWEPASGLLVGGWTATVAPGAEAPPARVDVWRA